jgi:opacity protein-like surface antigen
MLSADLTTAHQIMKRILACSVAASAFLFRAMAADVPNVYDGNGHGEPTRGATIPHRVDDLDGVTPL